MSEEKEQIKQLASLTEVIAQYTPVRGKKALCPFHADKNPSLSISESKGLWHCWSCGAGGDTFTFVMRAEEVSFPAAVKILCDRYGITQTYNSPAETSDAKRRADIRKSEIIRLKQKREEELARLNEHDSFMSDLWKKVYRSNSSRKEAVLEAIEECFMIIEEEHKKLERWFENESGKVYRKALHKIGGRSCVSQI